MIAKYKGIVIEGRPEEVYTFYLFSKFEKTFVKQIKNEMQNQKNNDYNNLLIQLKNKFKED